TSFPPKLPEVSEIVSTQVLSPRRPSKWTSRTTRGRNARDVRGRIPGTGGSQGQRRPLVEGRVPDPGDRGAVRHAPAILEVPRSDQPGDVRREPVDLRPIVAAQEACVAGCLCRAGERGPHRGRQA